MGWSLKLGKWFGIEVNLHITFLLLIGFLALTGLAATRNAGAVAGNIGFLLALEVRWEGKRSDHPWTGFADLSALEADPTAGRGAGRNRLAAHAWCLSVILT